MLTRGQSDRLSADAMIHYFQPLYLWLKVQNRNESVIGWTTNLQDEALFQPFLFGSSNTNFISLSLTLFLLIIVRIKWYL